MKRIDSTLFRVIIFCTLGMPSISELRAKVLEPVTSRVTQLTFEGKNYEPMWSPDGMKILFESTRDGNLELYVMDADGANQIRLTHNSSIDASPSWHPNGTSLLFFSNRVYDTDKTDRWKLFEMPIGAGTPMLLGNLSTAAFRPVVSPDSSKIAFDAWVHEVNQHQVFVMNYDGSLLKQLTHTNSYESAPQWSPDGSKIVFSSQRDFGETQDVRSTPAEIYLMDANGADQKRLTSLEAKSHYPYWSPDGARIAFETDVTGNMEIFVITLDGSNLTNVTNHSGRDTSVSWLRMAAELRSSLIEQERQTFSYSLSEGKISTLNSVKRL